MSTDDGRNAVTFRVLDDRGFTIVEILMAMVILLIAFTGIMSLMTANTYMNVRAKEKIGLINEANSYIERVRQMKFEDIAYTTSVPPGLVEAYETTINGYEVEVTPTIIQMTDPEIIDPNTGVVKTGVLKRLNIVLVARRPGSTVAVQTYETETVIKETDSGLNDTAQLPDITPTASSLASDYVVVSGDSWEIGAVAKANGEGVVLTSMNFYCDNVALRDRSGGLAQWTLGDVTSTRTFSWDTLRVENDAALSGDGEHTLKIEVWDSNGRQNWFQWKVIVDNYAPVWPPSGSITATATTSSSVDLAWTQAYDGNLPAHHYSVDMDKSTSGSWVPMSPMDFARTSGVYAAEPFTRYQFRVTAVGPPSANRRSETATPTVCTTRPHLTGTWRTYGDTKNTTTELQLSMTPPTFQHIKLSTFSYVYKSTSPDMSNPVQVGNRLLASNFATPQTFTVETVTGNGTPDAVPYYYQAKTVIGTSTYWSQVVGPNGVKSATPLPLNTVRW